ncbi:UbiX family flavin prenyltransferase [bacterium]|nr:MAG: UbiX family flavin prenyltransferase [bacterium]
MKSFIVAITGASGSVYGLRLVEALLKSGSTIHLSISHDAFIVLKTETGIHLAGNSETEKNIQKYFASKNIHFYSEDNILAPISSGSFITDGMFVVPCSMKTLSAIAHGYANNLIERAADVTVKEGRKLILSPREMPFSAVHLENMLKLSRLGVTIASPIPAFYHKPKDVNDMVNFVVGKILDCAEVPHTLFKRWE